MGDDLARWAEGRVDALIARAEAEAVAELRSALLAAAASGRRTPARRDAAAEPATRPHRAAQPPGEVLLWAYCVTSASAAPPEEVERLVPLGSDLERVEHEQLAAFVSRVPAEEYAEAALHDSLNDLAWLEQVARAHETVLERIGERATLVPLRLCTIFSSEDGVRRMLRENEARLRAALDRLEGRQEWTVKLLVDPERLEAAAGVADDQATAGGAGTAYMLGRRADQERREVADRLARALAEDVHARLQDWAIDAVVNPPQSRELSGHEGEMRLNGAYLVESARADELRGLVAELQERHRAAGARLELAGPLPPFNFVPEATGASGR